MKKVQGDLLQMFEDGDFNIIVHGCNCHHNMSGGIAAQIAERYPQVLKADNLTTYGMEGKLGMFTRAYLNEKQTIINAYTQFYPGADARLGAIHKSFVQLSLVLTKLDFQQDVSIGIPMIGCGIGGLIWEDVERVLDRLNLNLTVVEYVPE